MNVLNCRDAAKNWLVMFAVIACIGGFASSVSAQTAPPSPAQHTFKVGEKDFLLDGKPIEIHTGEMHFTRVPREYWRNRLQSLKAMGMNAVCAYLFWNYHEWEPGKFDWSGQADAAEFCRIAQEEGLWVVLRPGPYVCAEWDGGGLPWWLLKNDRIRLRTTDPIFMKAATAWLAEVGRVLGPQQITRGGPIVMAQVENEYGSFGRDAAYIGALRQALIDAGFDVPLFACNPPNDLGKGFRSDLFQVVNFGNNPQNGFTRLRQVQPTGPLMCGEFYPGWFDTWGAPHHLGNNPRYLADLEYMLQQHASFSLYMAHGGTTFGLWAGADRPFKPDTTSYDYDAPLSESGQVGEKFQATRALMLKYLPAAEKLPDSPAPIPTMTVPSFDLTETAPIFANLPAAIQDAYPRNMEAYDQGHGCIVYRRQLPAGPEATLDAGPVGDFGWIFLDGKPVGTMDRRSQQYSVKIPTRDHAQRLDILVEAMGHVNYGNEVHDRKGLHGAVKLVAATGAETKLEGDWQVYPLRLDGPMLESLKWNAAPASGPALWRGRFEVAAPADTFLDMSTWGKGVIWVNGHCLARFWDIGPTQTAYLPGAWLKAGANEVVVLDLLGPSRAAMSGLNKPILDSLRLELDFSRKPTARALLQLDGIKPIFTGTFLPGPEAQQIRFPQPVTGRQFCIESVNAHDGKAFAAIAEIDLLNAAGNSISHANWKIAYVDSEELAAEDGSASNAIDGQVASFWHSTWQASQPNHPHQLVIDLGQERQISGFRYVPRPGAGAVGGRIKDYRIYVGPALAKSAAN